MFLEARQEQVRINSKKSALIIISETQQQFYLILYIANTTYQ